MSQNPKPKVKLYTTVFCPYCKAAKRLLAEREIPYEEIDLSGQANFRQFLQDLTGQRTVPQILINDEPIGGYMDLLEMDQGGELWELLDGTAEEAV